MSAAEENTRGMRMAAQRGTRINNTNKVDFSGAKIGAFNSGNSMSTANSASGMSSAGNKKTVKKAAPPMMKGDKKPGKPGGKPGKPGVTPIEGPGDKGNGK